MEIKICNQLMYNMFSNTWNSNFKNLNSKNAKYENQYFVGKPFTSITALHLRGMPLTGDSSRDIGSLFHSSFRASKSSFSFFCFFPLQRWSRIVHKFSIGFKSGYWAGQSILGIFLKRIQSLFMIAVCFGSLSSWNIHFDGLIYQTAFLHLAASDF